MLVIAAACAIFAVVRGIARLLLSSLVLCGGMAAAYYAWRYAPVVGAAWVAPTVAGFAAGFILRTVVKFFSRPFRAEEGTRPSGTRRLVTLLFSLAPASVLSIGGATAVRNFGSVSEIRKFADGEDSVSKPASLLAELKAAIDRTVPNDWLRRIDPMADDARVTLAKLIARGDEAPPPRAIPVLEEPQIRDLIQGDSGLRQLAREGRYAEILRDPRLTHVVEDPDLRKILTGLKL